MSNIPPPPDIGGIHRPDPRQHLDLIWVVAVLLLVLLGLTVLSHAQLNGLYVRPDGTPFGMFAGYYISKEVRE